MGIGFRYSVSLGYRLVLEGKPATTGLAIIKNITINRMTEFGAAYASYETLKDRESPWHCYANIFNNYPAAMLNDNCYHYRCLEMHFMRFDNNVVILESSRLRFSIINPIYLQNTQT